MTRLLALTAAVVLADVDRDDAEASGGGELQIADSEAVISVELLQPLLAWYGAGLLTSSRIFPLPSMIALPRRM